MSEQHPPYQQTTQPPQGQPYPPHGYQQPPKKSHTLRNVLLVLGLLAILFVGGCVAIVGLAANEVGKGIDEAIEADKQPGGPDNPLKIKEGEAFEVAGFDYAAGWRIAKDYGMVSVEGLKVTNNRDDKDSALVEIKFWKGSEVLALVDCSTEPVAVGTTTTLSCGSGDDFPKGYDKITINDTF